MCQVQVLNHRFLLSVKISRATMPWAMIAGMERGGMLIDGPVICGGHKKSRRGSTPA